MRTLIILTTCALLLTIVPGVSASDDLCSDLPEGSKICGRTEVCLLDGCFNATDPESVRGWLTDQLTCTCPPL